MTEPRDMPYGQKVVSDYLRDNLGGVRVVAHPPDEKARATPWVMVTQMPGTSVTANDPAKRVTQFYFQFDCYAGKTGGMPEAERLARTVNGLLERSLGSHPAPTPADDPVVVCAWERAEGPFSLPDDDAFDPARDRFVLGGRLYAHPD